LLLKPEFSIDFTDGRNANFNAVYWNWYSDTLSRLGA
jgi:hypothetical protein